MPRPFHYRPEILQIPYNTTVGSVLTSPTDDPSKVRNAGCRSAAEPRDVLVRAGLLAGSVKSQAERVLGTRKRRALVGRERRC